MVGSLNPQIDKLFLELIPLLSAEAKSNSFNSQFLRYVQDKYDFVRQTTDEAQIKEVIRGINRYADEFSFTDMNAGKIKKLIENIYDLANHS